jgi:hypothetical protein
MNDAHNENQGEVKQPSSTNPQCKVCMSSDRFEIEVALAEGQPQETVARRFSRNGQAFSRQNIHSHYRRHMQVIDRAVTEAAAGRMRNRMLDLGTAMDIEDRNERSRELMRQQVAAQIENNQLRWSARDAMAFIEQDARLGEQRSAALLDVFMVEARAFSEAVRSIVPPAQWQAIVDEYDRLMEENGGPTDPMHRTDDSIGGDGLEA